MMDKSRTSAELRGAFYELAMGGSSPDPETLEALIRLYPNHSVELTDFAISLALDPWPDDDGGNLFVDAARAEEGISAAASHAVSAYQNAVYKLRQSQGTGDIRAAASASIENPFLALDRKTLRDVAARLDADVSFVIKLRDRVIDYATMTHGFVAAVSDAVPAALRLLETHLSSTQPVAPAGQHFKADDKPVLGRQQSFKEAVETSEMSERQRQRLLSL